MDHIIWSTIYNIETHHLATFFKVHIIWRRKAYSHKERPKTLFQNTLTSFTNKGQNTSYWRWIFTFIDKCVLESVPELAETINPTNCALRPLSDQ